MSTRPYSLTYPQIMNQALAQNLSVEALARLRKGYEVAEELFDGFYRGQGMPFVCHLIRTASIVLAEQQPIHVVLAALLHAAYMRECFQASGGRHRERRHRLYMQQAIGADVEALIWTYDRLPWYSLDDLEKHVTLANSCDGLTRQVLTIRLANQLEDYLDLAMVYRGTAPYRERIRERGELTIALAQALGLVVLAAELKEAYHTHLANRVPATAMRRHASAYESWQRQRSRMGPLGRLRVSVRPLVKRVLVGMGHGTH